ncbi:MAG: hypothetical protein M1831_005483 [Alyxoria varia]|nr:MAG: hypothetical protein M1831_005483 [Alyxoria varia]
MDESRDKAGAGDQTMEQHDGSRPVNADAHASHSGTGFFRDFMRGMDNIVARLGEVERCQGVNDRAMARHNLNELVARVVQLERENKEMKKNSASSSELDAFKANIVEFFVDIESLKATSVGREEFGVLQTKMEETVAAHEKLKDSSVSRTETNQIVASLTGHIDTRLQQLVDAAQGLKTPRSGEETGNFGTDSIGPARDNASAANTSPSTNGPKRPTTPAETVSPMSNGHSMDEAALIARDSPSAKNTSTSSTAPAASRSTAVSAPEVALDPEERLHQGYVATIAQRPAICIRKARGRCTSPPCGFSHDPADYAATWLFADREAPTTRRVRKISPPCMIWLVFGYCRKSPDWNHSHSIANVLTIVEEYFSNNGPSGTLRDYIALLERPDSSGKGQSRRPQIGNERVDVDKLKRKPSEEASSPDESLKRPRFGRQ